MVVGRVGRVARRRGAHLGLDDDEIGPYDAPPHERVARQARARRGGRGGGGGGRAKRSAAREARAAREGAFHAAASCRATASTWSTIRAGMFTPVVSMLLRNSIVSLTSFTSKPCGDSSTSTASTPPPTARAAARHRASSSGVTGQFSARPPRAVLVIQCGECR